MTYHIISLRDCDLVSNHCSRLNSEQAWLYYLHNQACNNNVSSPNIHLMFTEKIPYTCNVLTLGFTNHFTNWIGHQIDLISNICSGWTHQPSSTLHNSDEYYLLLHQQYMMDYLVLSGYQTLHISASIDRYIVSVWRTSILGFFVMLNWPISLEWSSLCTCR